MPVISPILPAAKPAGPACTKRRNTFRRDSCAIADKAVRIEDFPVF